MKTIKPQKLGVLFRTIERGAGSEAVFSIFVYFDFNRPDLPLAEIDLWKLCARELPGGALDEGLWKPCGELLVHGTAYAPGGEPTPAWPVRASLGTIDKTLWIVGTREFRDGAPTEPAAISSLPLSYAHAFGGAREPRNPIGKGAEPRDGVQELPNIESADQRMRNPHDRPEPVGFGPYDLTWPQRFQHAGTYDEAWLERDFPGYARDMNPAFFNVAPLDQRLSGYMEPGARFVLENLHPERARIEGRLPSLAARCFVNRRTSSGEAFEEVTVTPDTVHLFPSRERGVVVYRGIARVDEDDASDILQLILAAEATGVERPVEHYRSVLARRLDKEKGHLHALRDADLLPAISKEDRRPDEASVEMERLLAREGILERRGRARIELELEKARRSLREQGIDPDKHIPKELPSPEPTPDVDDLAEVVEGAMAQAEDAKKQGEASRQEAEAKARAACQEAGLDFAALVAKQKLEGARRPKITAEEQLSSLRDQIELCKTAGLDTTQVEATLGDPSLATKLKRMERQLREVYVRYAHLISASRPGERGVGRDEAVRARDAGESLAGRDLAGFDLSGLDLRGVDLRGAFLEDASLVGSDLAGANLEGAVLAWAKLEKANLQSASLRGANLGSADLTETCFEDADLEDAVLSQACLARTELRGARLQRADLSGAHFEATSFAGARMAEAMFLDADLRGVVFDDADLTKAAFLQSDVSNASFVGAVLVSAAFVTTKADGAVFRDANLENLRVVKDSSFAQTDLRGARLDRASARATSFRGADFTDARLVGADFSEGDLEGAKLPWVDARDARFVNTNLKGATMMSANLMGGILQRANLAGVDLRHANLFRSDLLRVRVDRGTTVDGAELGQARFKKDEAKRV